MKQITSLFRTSIASISNVFVLALMLIGSAVAASAQNATATATNNAEADKAWKETRKATQSPMAPKEWQDKEPTKQEITDFYVPALLKGADKAKDFYTKYPEHPKAAEARKAEFNMITLAVKQFGDTSQSDRLAILTMTRLKDTNLSESERWDLRLPVVADLAAKLPAGMDEYLNQAEALRTDFPKHVETYELLIKAIGAGAADKAEAITKEVMDSPLPDATKSQLTFDVRLEGVVALIKKLPAGMDQFMTQLEALRKEFPTRPEVYQVMMVAMEQSEGDKAKLIAKEIMDGDAPAQIKDQVKGTLKRMEAVGKPLDIKYTAFDGREVDLSKMKGKVVLIDFWATWCGPCIGELPNVKAAYEKLHGQGFEIVGISFDSDKDALTQFLAKEKTPWPQFFDGLQWKNKYGVEFGINSIPTMWLVDKNGNLADINARGALEEKVSALLKK